MTNILIHSHTHSTTCVCHKFIVLLATATPATSDPLANDHAHVTEFRKPVDCRLIAFLRVLVVKNVAIEIFTLEKNFWGCVCHLTQVTCKIFIAH